MTTAKTDSGFRLLASVSALAFASVVCWMAARHAVASHWAFSSQPEQWRRAADIEPDNPENWYRLGRYYQIDFEHADLTRAISNYARATRLAPGTAEYWMDIAESREAARQPAEAEQAFRKAQQAYPISAEVAWRFGNFLLRQNRQNEAYQQIHRALSVQPGLTALAISRCWPSSRDIETILNVALPADPDAYWGAIDYLIDAREPDAAMVVWKQLMAGKPDFPVQKAFRLEELLIATGHAEDVQTVWRQSFAAAAAQHDLAASGSAVWNGGFEGELLDGGLGWRFGAAPGAELNFDPAVAHSGSRSLRVVFDGSSNVDFKQPFQFVVLQATTRYRLTAYFQTEHLTTSTGLRFELQDTPVGNIVAATENLKENQAWTASEFEFRTGTETKLYRLTLRRVPSSKFDNKISGTIWLDDVSLTPLLESSALR
jgi:hypothetical protein